MILSVTPSPASLKIGDSTDMRYLLRVPSPGNWIECFSSVNFVNDKVLSLCQKFGHPCTWRKGLQLGVWDTSVVCMTWERTMHPPPWLVEIQALFKHGGDG